MIAMASRNTPEGIHMPEPVPGNSIAVAPGGSRRFEIFLAGGLLLFGLLVLPALIYLTGTLLLGEYSGGTHLGSFLGDFTRDLAGGSARAWSLVVGPYVLVQVGRLIFREFGGKPPAAQPENSPPQPKSATARSRPDARERREPTFKV